MKSWKKWCLGIGLLITLTVIAACGGNGNGNNESVSSETGGETASDEPFKFSIMANLHTAEVPDKAVQNLLEEATNTVMDIQWVPDNNYEERLNTAFATGSLPQAVYMKNQTTYNQFKDAIRDDQFWEIGPYLDEFPNLQNLKPEVIENTMVDGKVYGLYQGRPLSRSGIIYRKDWADNLGIEAPTNVEEFMEMARAFTEDDPDGNGRDDTFGLTDRSDLVYGAFKSVSSWFGTPNGWGEKDGQLLPEFMFDEYMETLEFFREMHSNKFMNQDFPVTSKNDQQALFKNGTAGIYVGSMGDVVSLYAEASQINPDLVFDVHNYVEGPNGEYNIWAIPGYGNLVIFPKSAVQTEEELKGILSFYNQLMEPENANLIYWGIEGDHYTVDGDRAVPSEDTQRTDREVKPYQSIEIGEADTNGRYLGKSMYDVKLKADELEIDNEQYLIHDPTITLDSATEQTHGERLQQIINDATYQYILGQIDEAGFENAIQTWKTQGGENIINEYNESYQQ
ncbi:ABC transporter substrate-binding protein [Alkalihalobacillus alcalophilus ATCC 27647 = CGMCC 1.3604]|uniref:ABC transporter substrate-binding protein n=1 Tax=Alkalihalobacillus alcalophilus ATCC 27647 = CGMCC 1.3604 TaxID=1218173 RepID=A0A094WKR0_ALKAL|nr:extracellular solute-binding protein [Alkalihalobacillus alcalophilus]KGA97446.1 ABC transporter substrate-binding protein [Alkalihalobacillus alcalophilus ATCC 27647 = CGMCC 1.3604]MED1562234.1 extracellular solute-binding protein [Alkalihalobacillus alcalophilus]THG90820.1 ABC transporter substrate-binding protein [Alkalihalobacillus alcalophilus ATCC 27647 = CGMCC 1.3604]